MYPRSPGRFFLPGCPVRSLQSVAFIVANEIVAGYYGLASQIESGFNFAPLVHHRNHLGGLLSQASILAGLSDGRDANPVKRGAWIARKIVAEPPDDPPPLHSLLGGSLDFLRVRPASLVDVLSSCLILFWP